MSYRAASEDIEPDHYVVWLLDLPGCFSSAPTFEQAITHAPDRIAAYFAWLFDHDSNLPVVSGPFKVELTETFQAHRSDEDPDYLVNAFFEDDKRPLRYWDVEAAIRLLTWSHQDLHKLSGTLSQEGLYQIFSGEVHRTIAGILEHIAAAENWYLSQLELALDWSSLSDDPLMKLEAVRTHTQAQMSKLIDFERTTIHCGEKWSARKVLRRTLWHERDHIRHIEKLIGILR